MNNSPAQYNRWIFSGRFDYSTGTDAAGASIDPSSPATVSYGPDFLQVWQPATTILIVRVAYVVTGNWTFSTNFTYAGHDIFSLNGIHFQ